MIDFLHLRHLVTAILIYTLSYPTNGKPRALASIPFELSGDYIVLKACINDNMPLNLILDTGIRNTIITELNQDDSLDLVVHRTQKLDGIGQGKSFDVLVSDSNTIHLGKMNLPGKTVYVFEENIFKLSQYNGRKINGLLGMDILQNYVIQIDYNMMKLRFYDPETFTAPSRYAVKPIVIEHRKAYLILNLLSASTEIKPIKMLIDTGAQLNAWFQTVSDSTTTLPEQNIYARIGEGFSGEVYGYFARIPMICMEQYCFKEPIVVFPEPETIRRVMQYSDRDGTIGSGLLSRFNLYIDIPGQKIYFRPNSSFKAPFRYNIAGIEIEQTAFPFPGFTITHVWKNSPAEKAGVLPGDMLLEINKTKVAEIQITDIRGIFHEKSARPIQLLLLRGHEKLLIHIEMKDLLKCA